MAMELYEHYLLSDAPISTVMVFPIGGFKTSKYPKLNLTRAMADSVIENFDKKVLGATEPFIDSSGRHDEGAPAAGWVKSLYVKPWQNGDALFADIEWTSEGIRLVRGKLYKYLSPVLAPHVIPETGQKVYPVLRSMTLTNIPVLRMMPAIEASEQGEPVEIACSELMKVEEVMDKIEVAAPVEVQDKKQETPPESSVEEPETPDVSAEPSAKAEEDIVEQMQQILSRLNSNRRGKKGAPALRALMKDAIDRAKVSASEGDEDYSEIVEMLYTILAEFDKSGKEMKRMQKLVDYFKLAEGADEDAVLAAFEVKVTELSESCSALEAEKAQVEMTLAETVGKLTTLEATIAEQEKAARDADVQRRIDVALSEGHILPADIGDEEHPGWLRKLSETSVELFEGYLDSRIAPAVDTRELGEGQSSEAPVDDRPADVKLARMAEEYAKAHTEFNLGEAQNIILAENKELAEAYMALRNERLGSPRV
jgi:phage I-like protein